MLTVQLSLLDLIDAAQQQMNCSECGEGFDPDDLNHFDICSECIVELELRADENVARVERRDGLTGEEKTLEARYAQENARRIISSGYSIG